MGNMDKNRYLKLEKEIEYTFNNIEYLDTAFTHKSFANEILVKKRESYERLEFLGDAILEFVVSDFLYNNYSNKSEGELTKTRASLVCEYTLSKLARKLDLGSYCYFSKGEKATGGADRDSILCDLFESVVGALYLDGGIEVAKKYIYKYLLTDIEHKTLFYDSKTRLQEYAQKNGLAIKYMLVGETGPEHNKEFIVKVFLGEEEKSTGKGHSRKAAEQQAAYETLKRLL